MSKSILTADFIITMDAGNRIIEHGAVAIDNDRIAMVGPVDDVTRTYPDWPIRLMRNRILMPGLVNAHLHSGILRGTAEGLPVWDWLRPLHPSYAQGLSPREAEAASWLCYAEAVLSGTTTVIDMWRFMDGSARAAAAIGNRSIMVPYVDEHPDYAYFDHLDDTERLLETWHGQADGRVSVWVGLEHAFYSTEEGHRRAIDLAKKFRTGFHTHSNEAEIELKEMDRRYGVRPIHALDRLGLLDAEHVLLAHCVWLDDSEIELLAKTRGRGRAQPNEQHETRERRGASSQAARGRRSGRDRHGRREGEQQSRHVRRDEVRLASREICQPGRRRARLMGCHAHGDY